MERTPPDRRGLLHACREGVVAICELAAHFSDWSVPTPCREWDALDLAGHLRCVAENFHEYLNDAPPSTPLGVIDAEHWAKRRSRKRDR